MEFRVFFERCRNESTVSDFESYLSYCIFKKTKDKTGGTVENYARMRDLAFDRRDESAARSLYEMAGAADWEEGDWEGALR